jgi:LytS/YehU family sensor histidine kinase
MLVSLGQLLRASLEGSQTQEVPLREELALLERYIELEKMRLEDRLRMYWEIDRSLLSVPVPRLLLQPLVENAIRHALGQRLTPGKVVVRVARQQDWLVLEVRDDGQAPATQPAPNGNGIGLANTRARLRALYGDEHSFALTRTDADDGTVAQVKLPIRMLEQAA